MRSAIITIRDDEKQVRQYFKGVKTNCSECRDVLYDDKLISIPLIDGRVQPKCGFIPAISNSKVMFVSAIVKYSMSRPPLVSMV